MRILIILLCCIVGSHASFAQSNKLQAMEDELVSIQDATNKIWVNLHNFDGDLYSQYIDSMNLLCVEFDEILNRMIVEDKEMAYPFTKLLRKSEYRELLKIHVIGSNDNLLRVFSWELPGGTMHYYGNTIQYKNANSIVHSYSLPNSYNSDYSVDDTSYEYDTVYTLKDKDKTIYILSGSGKSSTQIVLYQLNAFSIKDELVTESIFEDKNGNATNKISDGYDIGCSNINENVSRPIIDEEKKMMNLLEIKEDCFTGNFIKYKFYSKKLRFKIKIN